VPVRHHVANQPVVQWTRYEEDGFGRGEVREIDEASIAGDWCTKMMRHSSQTRIGRATSTSPGFSLRLSPRSAATMDTTQYDTRGDGKDGARQRLHFTLAVEEGDIDMHVEIVARTRGVVTVPC
jgi:hypothetical protein